MAQTCSYTRLSLHGGRQGTLHSSGINPSAILLASVVGPATSVSDGMTIDVSEDLKTKCYGGRVIGYKGTAPASYDFWVKPASSWTSSATKIVATTRSTGTLLTGGTALNGYRLVVEFVGY